MRFSAFYVSKIEKTIFFGNEPIETHVSDLGFLLFIFQLLTSAQSGRDRLQEKMAVVRKNPKDIHDLFSRIPAFPLQRYCGLPTRKAMLQLPSEILQPCG